MRMPATVAPHVVIAPTPNSTKFPRDGRAGDDVIPITAQIIKLHRHYNIMYDRAY